MDLDEFLLIVRAGGTVRTTAAKGDALASGGPWGVAWRRAVADETAFHGYERGPEERERERDRERRAGEARGRIERDTEKKRSERIVV